MTNRRQGPAQPGPFLLSVFSEFAMARKCYLHV